MLEEIVVKNAIIVTPDTIIEGSVHVREGVIADVQAGQCSTPSAVDCEGDYLIPGLIDLHTNNLERHLRPRRDADWPVLAAVMAHDAEMVSAGVTTILDALYVGARNIGGEFRPNLLSDSIAALETGRQKGVLRGDHMLHLRAETSRKGMPELFASVYPHPEVRMVSVMDHTPGQRQFANGARMGGRLGGLGQDGNSDSQLEPRHENEMTVEERQDRYSIPNRARLLSLVKGHRVALASHDDTTAEHVDQALAEGIAISEFPTTVAAAQLARSKSMKIVAGSPNLVLGRSRTGNVAVEDLAKLGLLDVLASDYVPASLLHGVFLLSEKLAVPLNAAVALAISSPARMVGLYDRGSIEIGKRADLVRVGRAEGVPFARVVWREGRRVA